MASYDVYKGYIFKYTENVQFPLHMLKESQGNISLKYACI